MPFNPKDFPPDWNNWNYQKKREFILNNNLPRKYLSRCLTFGKMHKKPHPWTKDEKMRDNKMKESKKISESIEKIPLKISEFIKGE